MRAIVIREPGGPEVLEMMEMDSPEPGLGEVRVRVRRSGLNRADLSQRRGRYPAPPDWPQDIPGLEFAGEVETVGPGVHGYAPGDRVMGIVGGGGYAEFVVTHARTLVPVPENLDEDGAGAVPEVFMTAFDALFLQLELALGETLLIHAVGSGVGTAAVQLARASGVRTLGTSRTPEKLAKAAELGLDFGVVGDEHWPREVREATGGRGADAILDLVGGAYLAGNLEALAQGGRQIVVGVPSGSRGDMDLRVLMAKRASIRGTVLRARPLEEKALLAREFARRVTPLLEAGVVRPVLDRVFPAAEVASAHEYMESNASFGKILLSWD
jgi:putative PIG3 family NAD(P)H quinone oxidoreductase